jgi:hypothetical protein
MDDAARDNMTISARVRVPFEKKISHTSNGTAFN